MMKIFKSWRNINLSALVMFSTLVVGLSILAASGCGYHFSADGEPTGIKISSMAIPLMASPSSSLGFESDFTEVIRDEFISHSKVPLVSQEKAEVILFGKVTEIWTDPLSYDITQTRVPNVPSGTLTNYEVTDSRRLRVKLDVKLVERATSKVIWEEKDMEDRDKYYVSSDPMTNRYNQRNAVRRVARRLVDRIYLNVMERF
jgi:hypothetical protein